MDLVDHCARLRLPFPLLGINSDNGSEFTNDQFYHYCIDEEITFSVHFIREATQSLRKLI